MNYFINELNNLNNSIIGHYFSKKENKIEANKARNLFNMAMTVIIKKF